MAHQTVFLTQVIAAWMLKPLEVECNVINIKPKGNIVTLRQTTYRQ